MKKNHVIDSSVVGHVRTLKDGRELNLTRNPVHSSQKQGAPARDGTYIAKHISEFICLISGLAMIGSNGFLYNWKTGHAFLKRGYNVRAISSRCTLFLAAV